MKKNNKTGVKNEVKKWRWSAYALYAACFIFHASCFISCSNDESPLQEEEVIAVRFASGIETRAAYNGDVWQQDQPVGIFMMPTGDGITASTHGNIAYRATSSGAATAGFAPIDPSETIYYPQSGNVDFAAYSPWRATPVTDPYKVSMNTSNQSDPAALDLLYSNNAVNVSKSKTEPVRLDFNHAMSRLTFNVIKGAGMEGADFTGMTVTIGGCYTESSFDLATGSFGTPTAVASFMAREVTDGIQYEAIVVPQTTTGEATVTFTRPNGDSYVWTMGARTFAPAKDNVFDITISATSVTVTGEIAPWNTTPPIPGEATRRYHVTYDANGGTGAPPTDNTNYTSGDVVTALPGASLTPPAGKIFYGWNTAADGSGTFHKAGSTFTFNDFITLYAYYTGDGLSAANPTAIRDAADLAAIDKDAASRNRNYILDADIDLSTYGNWTPIGGRFPHFTGTLDGAGHTLSGMTINSATVRNPGLFDYIGAGGEVKNINMTDVAIDVSDNDSYAGGIAAYNEGKITNCSVSGTIIGTGSGSLMRSNAYVGGIAGENMGGEITNCYAVGLVQGTGNNPNDTEAFVGGIAGLNSNNGSVINCYAVSKITAKSSGAANVSVATAGGIVGHMSGGSTIIANCVALGQSVSAESSNHDVNIGRVMGRVFGSGTLNNNYGISGMTVNGSTASGTTSDKNGDGVSRTTISNQSWWVGTAQWTFVSGAWQWDDSGSYLPYLEGGPKIPLSTLID